MRRRIKKKKNYALATMSVNVSDIFKLIAVDESDSD